MDAATLDEFVEAALLFRQEHPEPVTFQQVVAEVRQTVGRQPPRADLRNALDSHPKQLAAWIVDLKERPIATRDTMKLLEEWITKPDDRRSIESELATEAAGNGADPEVTAAARVLGALEGEKSWLSIGVDRLPPSILVALVAKAADENEVGWLVDAACSGVTSTSKPAREALTKTVPDRVETEVAHRLRVWPPEAAANAKVAGRLVNLVRLARLTDTTAVRTAAIEGAFAVAKGEPPVWVGDMVGFALKSTGAATVPLDEYESDSVRQLLDALVPLASDLGSPRISYVLAVAASQHSSALGDPAYWRGIPVETIGELLKSTEHRDRLSEVAGDSVFRPKVLSAMSKWQVWQVFQLVGRWPALGRFVTGSHVVDAARRGGPSAQILADAQEQATAQVRGALAVEQMKRQELAETIDALTEDLAASRAAVAQLQTESDLLRDRIRAQAGNSRSALDAELRQARIDTLDALVGAAESLRNLAAVGGETQAAITGLHADMVRRLASFGVEVVGHEGERREPRPDLDGQPIAAPVVEVIAPAYVLVGDPVTPLRHAVVRSVDT